MQSRCLVIDLHLAKIEIPDLHLAKIKISDLHLAKTKISDLHLGNFPDLISDQDCI